MTTPGDGAVTAARGHAGRRSFARGLRQRHPLILVAALLLLAPALLCLQAFFVDGPWTAIPLRYWMSASNDPYTWVSWTTTKLKHDPPEKPLVVLVGGSSARESIWTGEGLAADIAAGGGPQVEAQSLTGMHQSLGGSVAIIDNLPNSPTTVLIGVSLLRMYYDPKTNAKQVYGAEYALESETLRRYAVEKGVAREYGTTVLPGLARAMATRTSRLSKDLLSGKPAAVRINLHTMDKNKPMTSEKRRQVKSWANGQWASDRLHKNLGATLELLDASLAAARARGLDVVLLELPHNATFIGAGYHETESYYQERLQALARSHGAHYLNFSDDLELEDADYIDFSHLRPSGRTVWQKRLGEELARLYEDGTLPSGAPTGTTAGVARTGTKEPG